MNHNNSIFREPTLTPPKKPKMIYKLKDGYEIHTLPIVIAVLFGIFTIVGLMPCVITLLRAWVTWEWTVPAHDVFIWLRLIIIPVLVSLINTRFFFKKVPE